MSVSLDKKPVSLRKNARQYEVGTPVEFVDGRRYRQGVVAPGGRSPLSQRVQAAGITHVVSGMLIRPLR